jgi:hypothetical protein
VRTNFCGSLELAQRDDDPTARYQRTIALDPASPLSYGSLATLAAYARNRFADAVLRVLPRLPRISVAGYGITDVQIHALRGERATALRALRDAGQAGWRGPLWRYYRDVDPNLDSVRADPEFEAVFADIEQDMARQRAELTARPKDAPLPLESAGA